VGAIVVDAEVADRFERRVIARDVAVSRRGEAPTDTWTRVKDWLADSLSYFL
jgi:hypothetical protein